MRIGKWVLWLGALAVLSGCILTDKDAEEVVLSDSQIKDFLSMAKMPQLYGFHVVNESNGIGYTGAARFHVNHMAKADFLHDEFPVIKIRGRSRVNNLVMLIDPSTPDSFISYDKAIEFRAKPLGVDGLTIPYRGVYNTGKATAYASVITQLRVHQFFFENVPVYVRMATGGVGPRARFIDEPQIEGVLGYENLRELAFIQIDYTNKKIYLSASIPYEAPEDALQAKIVTRKGYGLLVAGSIFDAERGREIDTPVVIDPAGRYALARADTKSLTTRQLSLGELAIRNVETLPFNQIEYAFPRVGYDFLSKYLVTICPQQGVVYFERPREK
jgi:hypothetical protein